ncbi:MAG: hypothetical protein ACXW3Z_13640, partial [Limisphaerales bacterium]
EPLSNSRQRLGVRLSTAAFPYRAPRATQRRAPSAFEPYLLYLLTQRNLAAYEKCLHQFTFSTDDHSRESLEPFSRWYFGLSVEPINHKHQLFAGNLPLLNSIGKVVE